MLIINSEELKQAVTMPAALEAVEAAYLDLGRGKAVNRPRTDTWASTGSGQHFYLLKSMDGIAPGLQVGAVRINSNTLKWQRYAGGLVKASASGRYVGLVVLFSMADGQPLAMFPDEYIQAMRVGATCGLAIKALAKESVDQAAVIGSGRQATAAIRALCCVRSPREIRVYSPNAEHRAALADRFAGQGINVRPAASAEIAVDGADLILSATSSLAPVCRPEWVQPGRFISCVKYAEVGDAVRARSDYVVVNAHEGSPVNYLPGRKAFAAHDPLEELGVLQDLAGRGESETDWAAYPELAQVLAGGNRPSPEQSVLFINNIGLGIQFAAIGAAVYARARELGLGQEVRL